MGKKIMNAIETTPWHTGTRTCTYVRITDFFILSLGVHEKVHFCVKWCQLASAGVSWRQLASAGVR